MKTALQLNPTPYDVQYARQLGVRYAVWGTPEYPHGYFALEDLMAAKEYFARAGLEMGVIENMPTHFYDQVMAGLPGRDEQLERICLSIRNMGKAGIPVLGYNWMMLGGISTDNVRGRGGARERRFELKAALRAPTAALDWRAPGRPIHLPDLEISREQMWANLIYFLERVLPVAEEAGVKLAAHPDDAPIPEFLGVARVLCTLDDFQRLIDAVPSPSNGIDFCQGTFSEMAGLDVIEAIHHFGAQRKILFAHFRDTQGTLPKFDEVFMDEGDTDMVAAARAYRTIRYEGLIRADHTPQVVDDVDGRRGFAFQIGYMHGLDQAAQVVSGSAAGASRPVPRARAAAARTPVGARRRTPGRSRGPHLAWSLDCLKDEDVMYAQQFGVTHLLAALDPARPWDAASLSALRNRVRKAGLTLAGVERLPVDFHRARTGQPGRDEEIASVCRFLEAAGQAGIGLVGYQWCAAPAPERAPDGRGQALVRAWTAPGGQAAAYQAPWEYLSYFLDRVLPAAERAAVRLACHPDDPPMAGGPAGLLGSMDGLEQLLALRASRFHGLDLCTGAVAAMPGAHLPEVVRALGPERIFMVHVASLRQDGARLLEAFLDEGTVDVTGAVKACRDAGYRGVLRPASEPCMMEDTAWGHRAMAFSAGYLRAVLQTVERA